MPARACLAQLSIKYVYICLALLLHTMINNKSSQRQLTKLTRENRESSQKYLANAVREEGARAEVGAEEEAEGGAAAVAVTVTATFTVGEHVVVLVAQNELEIVEPAEMANKQNCISLGSGGRKRIRIQ